MMYLVKRNNMSKENYENKRIGKYSNLNNALSAIPNSARNIRAIGYEHVILSENDKGGTFYVITRE